MYIWQSTFKLEYRSLSVGDQYVAIHSTCTEIGFSLIQEFPQTNYFIGRAVIKGLALFFAPVASAFSASVAGSQAWLSDTSGRRPLVCASDLGASSSSNNQPPCNWCQSIWPRFSAVSSGNISAKVVASDFSYKIWFSPWIPLDNLTFSIFCVLGFFNCET
jgi:hypothetical protein